MKKPWKCYAASNWADGLCFKYSNCMKVNCLLVLPVCLSLFRSLFCVYPLSLFLCLALVFVSVSQWILSVKNCGAIVVLEIQHQGQHQTFLLVLLFHNDLTSASGLYDKSLFCNDLNWASDLYDKSLFQHIFRSYMQAFVAACEDGVVAWHSSPSIAYRPSLVCLSLSERNKLIEEKIMFSAHKAGILKIHHTKDTFFMQ